MLDIKKRIDELKKVIQYHNRKYYDENINEISDYEYDRLIHELMKFETDYPEYKTANSPTNKAGGSTKRELGKVKHDVPVISLQDVSSKDEVFKFVKKVKLKHSNARFVVEQKIDGLSILLRYQEGRLIEGITRGQDGFGESVFENVLEIKDVPKHISTNASYFEVRGEVYMRDSVLKKINEKQIELGKEEFQNTRNLAAGTMRQLDSRVLKDRPLNMFVFNLEVSRGVDYMSHVEALESMSDLGFVITPDYKVCGTADEVWKSIEEIGKKRWNLGYGIDGAVVKVDRFSDRDVLGSTSKTPRWAIAFKYPPEEVETVVEEIIIQVGRTGRLAPLAKLKPVRIGGSTVSKATLHNQDNITEKDIRIGDTVKIIKAGDIIPKIEQVVLEKRPDNLEKYYIPKICPVCQSLTERDTNSADIKCTNEYCPSKMINKVIYFVSKAAMNIDTFGKKKVEKLFEEKYIKNFDDIYSLYKHKEKLIELGIIGREKSVVKLLKQIENSKSNSVVDLLTGLGIPNVGKESAKGVMVHFESLDDLIQADFEKLISIPDIGEITARGIIHYFSDSENIQRITSLKDAGVNMISEKPSNASVSLEGLTFVITGALSKGRGDYQKIIEDNGGKMAKAISKKTNYLLLGDGGGKKRTEAEELGIKVISETDFMKLLKEGNDLSNN
jgi:DNA ligase (NAD+)